MSPKARSTLPVIEESSNSNSITASPTVAPLHVSLPLDNSTLSCTTTAVNTPDSTAPQSTAASEVRDKPFLTFLKNTAWPTFKRILFHGVDQDIVHLQQRDARMSRVHRLEVMHSRASHYDNQTEHLYSFLQVLTACTQSFAHGYSFFKRG
jgi:solute carrier family 20 (sodium-dependent phosphate transporter)